MKATAIKATDLRTQTRNILERARFSGEHFVILTFGKPVAAIIGIEEYNALVQLAKQGSLPSSDKQSARSLQSTTLKRR